MAAAIQPAEASATPDASAPVSPTSPALPGEPDAPEVTCRGCVELRIPVTLPSQAASFHFNLPAPGEDFSTGSVEWRVQVPEASANAAFYIIPYVQNGADLLYAGVYGAATPLSSSNFPSGQWVSLGVDASAYPPEPPSSDGSQSFDNRTVERVGLSIGASADFTGQGTIRVLIDAVGFSGVPGRASVEFATGADGLVLNPFQVPEGTSEPIHHP